MIRIALAHHIDYMSQLMVYCLIDIHVQFPPTDYVGLILGSTAVATTSCSIIEGTMRVL